MQNNLVYCIWAGVWKESGWDGRGCTNGLWDAAGTTSPDLTMKTFHLGPAVLLVRQAEAPSSGTGEDRSPAVHNHRVPAPVLRGWEF